MTRLARSPSPLLPVIMPLFWLSALPQDGAVHVGHGGSSSSKKSVEEEVPEKTLHHPPLIHAEGNGSSSKQCPQFATR